MAYTIVIASRYLIPLFLYLFLSCSIYALFVGDVRKQSGAAALQMVFLFLMQFTAWLTIVIRTQQSKYLLFYAFLQILTLALPVLAWFIYPGISRIVMNHMCMLFSAGLIVLTRLDLTKAIKQLIIAGASFVVFLIVPWILRKCRFLEKLGWIYAGIGIAALGIVLILGQVTHGSKLSWSIGGITFQPSEFVKLTFVFFLAAVLSEKTGIRQVVAAGIGATAHVLILVLSKDLGSALILFMVYVFLMTISAHQPLYLAGGLVAGSGASLLAYRMFSHVQVRDEPRRTVRTGNRKRHAAGYSICGDGFHFFRSDRRAGAALWNWNFADSGSAVCPDDSSGGWSCRRILQKSCSRIFNFIPVSDVSDCRRRKQIYPADRCDASSCQLRWKQRDDDDPDVWRHRRRFCLAV